MRDKINEAILKYAKYQKIKIKPWQADLMAGMIINELKQSTISDLESWIRDIISDFNHTHNND